MNIKEAEITGEGTEYNQESVDSVLIRIEGAIDYLKGLNVDDNTIVEYKGINDPERQSVSKVLEILEWYKGELEARIYSKEAANFFIYKVEQPKE